MKTPLKERISDFIVGLLRPFINFFMSREITVLHEGETITKKEEPFFLISNHFNTWDSFIIMKHNKKPTRFVATEIAYLDLIKKLSMGYLARTIRKRVGKRDFQATKEIFKYIKMGYAIGLFPEGDNTFYGETLDIYQNTGRLIKKANINVILIKQQGGYISQPRWADYFSKKGIVHTTTKTLFKKEELKDLTIEQINQTIEQELYNNDYEFQKEHMYDLMRKKRAEGIERLIYLCNKCDSVLTVSGHNHDITCSNCGTIGTINNYELIEGNTVDNLVDYNHYQYQNIDKVINSTFSFTVTLNIINKKKLKNKKLGKFTLTYSNKMFYLKNNKQQFTFDMKKMKYPVNTMRHSFSFDYNDIYYNFTDIRHQFVLFEMLRYMNGSYKR